MNNPKFEETFNKLIDVFKDCSYEELLDFAKIEMVKINNYFSQFTSEHSGAILVYSFYAISLYVDQKITELEIKFAEDLFGLSIEQINSIPKTIAPEFIEQVYQIFDYSSEEIKLSIVNFCLCFLAVDHEINELEINFIKKFFKK